MSDSNNTYDLIVIGGGCNGAGIARDAAMRGLKVLLVEKHDFSAGTTGASSGMIHGGPRYMLYEVATTKLACEDAAHIRKIASHLCFRIPFLVPVQNEGQSSFKQKLDLELMETFFEAYDRFSPLKGGKPHTRLSKEEAYALEPSLADNVVGAVTFDEWGIDTARLCVLLAVSAKRHGAVVHNYTEVKEILREGNQVVGVRVRHLRTGEVKEYRSKVLFNATGPWAPKLAEMAGVVVKLRQAKGVHLIVDRRLTNVAVVSKCIDGRQIFINPHENNTLIGTTDDDFYGDLDDIPVTEDEIEYLFQGMERVYPDIRKCRIISTWRGARPTLWGRDVYEDELSREHEVYDHETRDGLKGFLTMAGGKLASFRIMAEEATDKICEKLGNTEKCTSHVEPLPGSGAEEDVQKLSKSYDVHSFVTKRLVTRQGLESNRVLDLTKENPSYKGIVCHTEPVMEAEIRYALREEMAETIRDVFRRTKLAAGSCQGTECLVPAVQIAAEEKKWSSQQEVKELVEALEEFWRARKSILKGPQLAQEEILQEIYAGVLDLENF